MPMELQREIVPAGLKEKVLAFVEEASLITGVAVGSVYGASVVQHDQMMLMEAPGPLLNGAWRGIMTGLIITTAVPVVFNYIANRASLSSVNRRGTVFEHFNRVCENAFSRHEHSMSQIYGMATGLVMSASLALSTGMIDVKELPIVQKLFPQTTEQNETFLEPPSEHIILASHNYSPFGAGLPIFAPKN